MKKSIIVMGICLLVLGGCSNQTDKSGQKEEVTTTETPGDNQEFEKALPDVGEFLFNADNMESIEISGKDLEERKVVETSVDIGKDKSVTLRIRRDQYGDGFGMLALLKPTGADLVSCLGDSIGDGCAFKEDFHYQMCCYDFDGDGVKEIVVAGGNKKDVLELRIFTVNPDEKIREFPEPVTEINGGIKAYVNKEGGISVMDSETHTSIYAYGEEE